MMVFGRYSEVMALLAAPDEISYEFNSTTIELGFNPGITDRRHKVYFHTLLHTYANWLVQRG